jgi:rhomboid protease GluP
MLVIVGINFVIGLTSPGIDNWGHGGGLAAGFLLGTLLAPRYKSSGFSLEHFATLRDTLPLAQQILMVGAAVLVLAAGTSVVSSLQASSPSTLLFRAQTLIEDEQYAEAERVLREAAQQDPNRVDTWFNLGVVRARQDNYIGALDAWEQAAALDPDLANLRWNLAIAHVNLGNRQAAIAETERFIDLARTPDEVRRGREFLAELQGGD